MHEGQRALHAVVVDVGEEHRDLRGREHALVDEGADGEAGEVDAHPVRHGGWRSHLVLQPLPQHVDATLEVHRRDLVGTADEELAQDRHRIAVALAQGRVVEGHVPPAQDAKPLVGHDPLDAFDRSGRLVATPGQEGHPAGVGPHLGQVEGDDRAQEQVGHLDEHPGPVAGVHLRALGAAVLEVAVDLEAHLHDGVALAPLHVDHEGNTAGVVLEGGVVETLGLTHASSFGFRFRFCLPGTTLAQLQSRRIVHGPPPGPNFERSPSLSGGNRSKFACQAEWRAG